MGRNRGISRIVELVERARRGEGGALVLRGAGSAGLTALLDRAVAAADGMTVLRARSVAAESGIGYSSLSDVLRPIIGHARRLPPLQADAVQGALAVGSVRPDDRLAVGLGTLGLLSAAADERPALVVLENAQWIDEPSAEALAFAARRVEGRPVAVLAAVDEDHGENHCLADLDTLVVGADETAPATTEAPPEMSVMVLGGFAATVAGRAMTLPGLTRDLVAALAVHGPMPSEELIELLWPGVNPDLGQGRLRKVLWRIRQAGAGDLVQRQGELLTLAPEVAVDVSRFTAAADAALTGGPAADGKVTDLARSAVALYGGDLLPTARFVEWTEGPRENLRRRFIALLDLLAADATDRGDHDEALVMLTRAIEADPYDEERYLRSAQLLVAQDRRGAALVMLLQAEEMLAALGLSVSPAAEELRRRLQEE